MRPASLMVDGIGALRHRITFQKRSQVSDGAGNFVSDFATVFTVAAAVTAKMGGEAVLASRLEGVQTWLITVRRSSQTIQITPDWRAVDARDATKIYAIKTCVDVDDQRNFLELTCESGVAA